MLPRRKASVIPNKNVPFLFENTLFSDLVISPASRRKTAALSDDFDTHLRNTLLT
jgi:hypothetical protein